MAIERWLRVTWMRVRSSLRRSQIEHEIDEELAFHIEKQIEAGMTAGLGREHARRAALARLGGMRSRTEELHAVRRLRPFEALIQDVRYAARAFRRSPGFAIAAILVLALGIGANTAVFSVVNAVLLKPLPYPEPDRLVQLMISSPSGTTSLVSVPQYNAWREETFFASIAAYQAGGPGVNLSADERPEHVSALHVSRDYFRLFGADFILGRAFSHDEDLPGASGAVVISHALWQRRFAGDPAILGKSILLGGEPHEVIGVVNSKFRPDPDAELWLPLRADRSSFDHTALLHVVARLRPNTQIEVARMQLAEIAQPFREKFPLALGPHESFTAESLQDVVVGDVRPALRLLMGAVGFVLIIACANAASLLLARGTRRRVEIATRAALGADRSRLLRQLLTESSLLALAGGALGLALGPLGVQLLLSLASSDVPRIEGGDAVPLDGVVLGFTLVVSTLTGLLFGLVPSVTASRVDLSSAFKDGAAQAGTARHGAVQSWLVVAEMTLALVLLVGSGLMIRTFLAIRSVNLGFDAEHVIALDTALTDEQYVRTTAVAGLIESVERRSRDFPDIIALAVTRTLPLDPDYSLPFRIDRRTLFASVPHHGTAAWHAVSPDYFKVLRIRFHAGRLFNELDTLQSQPVAIINSAMARQFWRQNPLGEKITVGSIAFLDFEDVPRHIVGIVDNVKTPTPGTHAEPMVYVPAAQVSDAMTKRLNRRFALTWIVRARGSTTGASETLERELRLQAGLPTARVRSLREIVRTSMARNDFAVILLTVFAAISLVLAGTGMYALMNYSVEQRTQEIGIRLALGASPADVRNAIVLHGVRLAAAGVILGLGSAVTLSRVLGTLMFGLEGWNPAVFASVGALLTVVALTAAFVPARRATRISPLDSIRAAG